MPQLDIYRAFDEISLILLLLVTIYILMILIVIPLLIKRIGIKKSQEEIENIQNWNQQIECLKKNLEIKEERNIIKL